MAQNDVLAASTVFPATMVRTSVGMVPLRDVMVAIAGAESGFGNSPGDPLSIYRDGGASERPWSCGGMTSFGAWQVNLPTWHSLVQSMSGLSSPCDMARWLADYQNCALVANKIVNNGTGLRNWTTWWSRDGGKTDAGDGNGLFIDFLPPQDVSHPPIVTPPVAEASVAPTSAAVTGTPDTTALLDSFLALGGLVVLITLLRRVVG